MSIPIGVLHTAVGTMGARLLPYHQRSSLGDECIKLIGRSYHRMKRSNDRGRIIHPIVTAKARLRFKATKHTLGTHVCVYMYIQSCLPIR